VINSLYKELISIPRRGLISITVGVNPRNAKYYSKTATKWLNTYFDIQPLRGCSYCFTYTMGLHPRLFRFSHCVASIRCQNGYS